jgi:hypothetical protein
MQLVITRKGMVEVQNQFKRKGISIAHGDENKNILQGQQQTNMTKR